MSPIGDDWRFCPRCGATLELRISGGSPRPACERCGFVFFANMGVGVAAVIDDSSGRVLLVQRADGQFGAGLWCLPCGYVEWGEDLRAAAAREALEEAGVAVEIGDVVQVTVNRHDPDRPTVGSGSALASSTLTPPPMPATTPSPWVGSIPPRRRRSPSRPIGPSSRVWLHAGRAYEPSSVRLDSRSIDNVHTKRIPSRRGSRMRIRGFEWDHEDDADGNVAHIAKHGVVPEEVEEALVDDPLVLRTGDGRYLGYGTTGDGRPLFVVFVSTSGGIARPLTARAMTDAEKHLYRRKRGKPR